MKIALIELYGHQEVLLSCYNVLIDEVQSISIYTTQSIKEDLETVGIVSVKLNWIIIEPKENPGHFLKSNEKHLLNCNWILLLTINRPYIGFARLKYLNKTILLIHNSHSFLAPLKHLFWTRSTWPEIIIRCSRFLLSGDQKYLKKILERVKVWGFPSLEVLQYVKNNGWIPDKQERLVFPLWHNQRRTSFIYGQRRQRGLVKICIPGTIKSNGRDYQLIVRVFGKILKDVKKPIQVCLLGVAKGRYGERIQSQFQQLANSSANLSVILYTSSIPQTVFNTHLLETDFMVLPLTAYSQYDGFLERLGYSTISGGVNDALRFGLPTLISASYGREESWGDLIQLYHSELELEMYMKDWILNKKKLVTDDTLAQIKLNGEKMRRIFLDSLLSN